MLSKCLGHKNFMFMSMGQSQLGHSSPSPMSHDNTTRPSLLQSSIKMLLIVKWSEVRVQTFALLRVMS